MKILAVAKLKKINSASSNEHLKIGEKHEKRGYFVTSNGHHRRKGAENFFGYSTFYALQHPQIWSCKEVDPQKCLKSKNIAHIYMTKVIYD